MSARPACRPARTSTTRSICTAQAVNPLSVRFAGTTVADSGTVNAIKARLKALLSVGDEGLRPITELVIAPRI